MSTQLHFETLENILKSTPISFFSVLQMPANQTFFTTSSMVYFITKEHDMKTWQFQNNHLSLMENIYY